MRLSFVLEQCRVKVDVGRLGGIGRAGSFTAFLRIGAVAVLGPKPMQRKGAMLGALGSARVTVAKFWRSGQIEHIEVEPAWCGRNSAPVVMATAAARVFSTPPSMMDSEWIEVLFLVSARS